MINTEAFGERLLNHGYRFASGVPCSFLKYLINDAINRMSYIAAVNEGDAVAIASGVHMGGQKSLVLMQNSGLTNAISPLTSLNFPFRTPILGFVSLRGEAGLNDEPQHELTGIVTDKMLDICGVAHEHLSSDFETAAIQLEKADHVVRENRPFFFIVRKNTFSEVKLKEEQARDKRRGELIQRNSPLMEMTRLSALQTIAAEKDDKTVLLASTGKTGRELYEIGDSKQHLYMVGSMGCVSSLGLGIATVKPQHRIIAIDGDGALLMRMGALATNGYYGEGNLLHILIDNNCHDSTGGQRTVSHWVDFPAIAISCGYGRAVEANSLDELAQAIAHWKKHPVLSFIRVRVKRGSKKDLGRPSLKPHEIKERLMGFLRE